MNPETGRLTSDRVGVAVSDTDMYSVQSALVRAVQILSQQNVESARLTAELLLGHVLGWDRVRVMSHPEVQLTPGAGKDFGELIRRRAAGEPLQYITGCQEFYGLAFHVTPAVLIPRPETEMLVENAVAQARKLGARPLRFADVGTGSGCIAVAFAGEVPHASGWGIDISVEALAVARENAARHGVLRQIEFLQGDLLAAVPPAPCLDLVLSNPPYVALDDAATLPAMVREHEPGVALFSGPGGYDTFERLIPQAAARLLPGGCIALEVGAGMSGRVSGMLEQASFEILTIAGDLQGIPRCILARRGNG